MQLSGRFWLSKTQETPALQNNISVCNLERGLAQADGCTARRNTEWQFYSHKNQNKKLVQEVGGGGGLKQTSIDERGHNGCGLGRFLDLSRRVRQFVMVLYNVPNTIRSPKNAEHRTACALTSAQNSEKLQFSKA